jgi:hypothetical protein
VPLDVVVDGEVDVDQAAQDVIALTKLNWNSAADHMQVLTNDWSSPVRAG